MRIRHAEGSIRARWWVRRWMVVWVWFALCLPGYIWRAFVWAAKEANEYADQYKFKEAKDD